MKEIERKFIVTGPVPFQHTPIYMAQCYLLERPMIVRVRYSCRKQQEKSFMTIKGKTTGISRTEIEFRIPNFVGRFFTKIAKEKVEKFRHIINHHGHIWEVDEFSKENCGLWVAEVELKSEDEEFIKPEFCGREVSHEPRFNNLSLSKNPFGEWDESLRS